LQALKRGQLRPIQKPLVQRLCQLWQCPVLKSPSGLQLSRYCSCTSPLPASKMVPLFWEAGHTRGEERNLL
jgi:hypothetical protein